MKLMWFHLMPYTELPDDFREKHPSVWVDIHSSLFDPRRAHHMYNDFMDELEYAAECGFDAVCVNEHHSNGYGLRPSPNLIASSFARRTTATASRAGLHSGRGLGRDAAVVREDALRIRVSLIFRLQGRPPPDARLLGGDEAARQGFDPVPRRLSAIRRRRREPRTGDGAVPRA